MTTSPRGALSAKRKREKTQHRLPKVEVNWIYPFPEEIVVDLPSGAAKLDSRIIERVLSEERSISVLGAAFAANPEPSSPELARSLQAEENWWRKIESQFTLLSSSDVAVLLGAKPTNRNFASAQRAAGKLLGYTRRHAALFPEFQFDTAKGAVLPVIPQLIAVARTHHATDEDLMLWLVARSASFAEQDRPLDHLNDQDQLLAAAEDHFGAIW